jgi:Fe-S cluster biogenesis protein NfuA
MEKYIENPELYSRVETAIDSLRPFFEADQGDIKLVGINKAHVAMVQMLGACKTCTISNLTLKAGIEDAVKRVAPEIKSVESVS